MDLLDFYTGDISNITIHSNATLDSTAYDWYYDLVNYLYWIFESPARKNYVMVMQILPYIFITMVCVSVVGNSLIIFVVLQPKNRRHTISLYIASLAVADLLINCGITFINFLVSRHYIEESYSMLDCKLRSFIGNCSECVSVWTLCIISIERTLSVTYPHKIRNLCHINRAKGIIAGTWFVAFLQSCAAAAIAMHFVLPDGSGKCITIPEAITFNQYYTIGFKTIILYLIPLPILLICTFIILYQISKRTDNTTNDGNRYKVRSSVTKALVAVNISFLLLVGPYGIYTLMEFFDYFYTFSTIPNKLDRLIARTILGTMVDFNSVINFFVYFFSGSRFRNELLNLLTLNKLEHLNKSNNVYP